MIKKTFKILVISILIFCFIFLSFIQFDHTVRKDGIPILGYHSIVTDENYENYFKKDTYTLSESTFRKQMDYLKENDYRALTLEEVNDYYEGTLSFDEKVVALTFDDGKENFNTVVKPIMEEYDFHATCFVIGKSTLSKKKQSPYKHQSLDKDELINNQYVHYYSHTYNLHYKNNKKEAAITFLPLNKIQEDFALNKSIVNDKYLAYPYGIYDNRTLEFLEHSSTKLAFSYNNNRNMTRNDERYALPRYITFNHMPFFYFKWAVQQS